MYPNEAQNQGYGPASADNRPRAGAVAIVAGVLGLLAAGALVWVLVEYFIDYEVAPGSWPTEMWIILGTRLILALLLLVFSAVTLARRLSGAWLLVLFALLTAATVVLEPLVLGANPAAWVEALFQLEQTIAVAIVLSAALGLLTALMAIAAAASRAPGSRAG